MKTITVKDQTWQRLTTLKAELMSADLDSVINYLMVEVEPEKEGGKNEYR